ncbi:hypothetical protein [Chryseobacterium sp. YIM B08800]|uniref:hypothetical protein n=1 Tax=Chryseobacterium sp. YIM B08800 TaxID=2984136 RepID=UPI00223F89EA|nr:hypothetical protein [Chryseobacterium sp. YIM B08800]
MIIGNIILVYGYQIFDFWWYRLLIAGTVIPVYYILVLTIRYYDAKDREEKAKDRLLKNYQSQYDEE